MTNAKEELEKFLEGKAKVKCAKIKLQNWNRCVRVKLKVNHTQDEFQLFLNSINYYYDSGYGG